MKKGFIVLLLLVSVADAGTPLWTFTPLTPTNISVPANGNGVVQYRVTNQSRKTHHLVVKPMVGVSQDTSVGYCQTPFNLGYQEFCILSLNISGAALSSSFFGGPVVCEQTINSLQCYQPSPANQLKINLSSAQYTIGGTLAGLNQGTVSLENNNTDLLTLDANAPFNFSQALTNGSAYRVTVVSQPSNQTCSVSHKAGVVEGANVTNVSVNCSASTYTVGGTVSGLSGTVVLQNDGDDDLSISSNGVFTFPTALAQNSIYNVTVLSQPANQICTVNGGQGIIVSSNVTNVSVICSTDSYTVGGTVTGLNGTVSLLMNGNDKLSISSNRSYTFPTPLAQGSLYDVTVLSQPAGQTCTVSNGQGVISSGNVTNVNVSCNS